MLRTPNTDLNGCGPHLLVEDIFKSSEPQHIVVTYDFSELSVFFKTGAGASEQQLREVGLPTGIRPVRSCWGMDPQAILLGAENCLCGHLQSSVVGRRGAPELP